MAYILKVVGSICFSLTGWTFVGRFPDRQCVITIAPHTSNCDFLYFLALGMKHGKVGKILWLGKHSIFFWPLGILLKKLGGLPVNRKKNNNLIQFIASHMKIHKDLCYAIAPEGTRSYSEQWMHGFYRIAQRANVPLCLGFLDYKHKRLGFGPYVEVTGDLEKDWQFIRDFYQAEWAKFPENFSTMEIKTDTKNAPP